MNLIAKVLILFILMQLLSVAHAAELRGILTGIRSASVHVTCPDWTGSSQITRGGGYRVASIPANQACSFTVNTRDAVSARIPFNTNNSVTIYNGSLRRLNNRILVIRQ